MAKRSQILALVGPSGCGKTTTLRLIAGLDTPDTGTVEINDILMVGQGLNIPPEKRRISMVFQEYALFPHLTVGENIAYGVETKSQRESKVIEMLSLVGLEGLERRMPQELSGGQQQRVALARALASDPQVVLLDEPFSNLDVQLRMQLREDVKSILKKSEVTTIFVTHDQQEALFMGDMVAVQNDGCIAQIATPERIFHAPDSRFVAKFMGIADFLPVYLKDGVIWSEIGPVACNVHHNVDRSIEVMVRPDDLTFRLLDGGSERIIGKEFRGGDYLYSIQLSSGLVVRCFRPHEEEYSVGSHVETRLNPGHSLLLFTNNGEVYPQVN